MIVRREFLKQAGLGAMASALVAGGHLPLLSAAPNDAASSDAAKADYPIQMIRPWVRSAFRPAESADLDWGQAPGTPIQTRQLAPSSSSSPKSKAAAGLWSGGQPPNQPDAGPGADRVRLCARGRGRPLPETPPDRANRNRQSGGCGAGKMERPRFDRAGKEAGPCGMRNEEPGDGRLYGRSGRRPLDVERLRAAARQPRHAALLVRLDAAGTGRIAPIRSSGRPDRGETGSDVAIRPVRLKSPSAGAKPSRSTAGSKRDKPCYRSIIWSMSTAWCNW